MLIISTLIITWIARNWWKLLLLLVTVIVIHEYMIRKGRAQRAAAQNADAQEQDSAGGSADAPEDARDEVPDGAMDEVPEDAAETETTDKKGEREV